MKHYRCVSKPPASAQFQPVLEFIGIFQALFALPGVLFSSIGIGAGILSTLAGTFSTTISALTGLQGLIALKNPQQP